MTDKDKALPPALSLNFQTLIGDKGKDQTQIAMQTYIDRDSSESEINELMDKCFKSLERRKAMDRIPSLERALASELESQKNLWKQIKTFDREIEEKNLKNPRSEIKMSALDTTTSEAHKINEKKFSDNIKEIRAELDKAYQLMGGNKVKAVRTA